MKKTLIISIKEIKDGQEKEAVKRIEFEEMLSIRPEYRPYFLEHEVNKLEEVFNQIGKAKP